MKEVVFFVAEAQHKNIKRQEEEIADLYFLEAEKAFAALTFESDKEILRSALEYLKKPRLK
jgi:bis(5'-nucleosidyl)-tetraphosphatase